MIKLLFEARCYCSILCILQSTYLGHFFLTCSVPYRAALLVHCIRRLFIFGESCCLSCGFSECCCNPILNYLY